MRAGLFFISIIFSVSIYANKAMNELSPEIRQIVYLSQKPCREVIESPQSRSIIIVAGLMHDRNSIKKMNESEIYNYIKDAKKLCAAFPNQSFFDLVNFSK